MNPTTESIDSPPASPVYIAESRQIDTSMKIQIISPEALDGSIVAHWNQLRSLGSVQQSPYFDPEFTKAVAKVRDDVRIAVAIEGNQIVSILPFQENSRGHAVPVGGRLNDWHGIIGKSSDTILEAMLHQAKLNSYKFHAMEVSHESLQKFYFSEFDSHYLDLSAGWEEYRKWVFRHSSTVRRQGQKTRALQRDIGDVHFEFESHDSAILERLIELKRARYQNSDTFDILGVDWASNLLRELHQIQTPGFRGVLSVLRAGDKLVGAHFGMLTDNVLHYWFPVYDPAYHKYSPGTELLLRSAEQACELGITKLDLGYGDDPYKYKFCNAVDRVAFGLANFNSLTRTIACRKYQLRNDLKRIPMKPLLKKFLRLVYPGFGGWNFR